MTPEQAKALREPFPPERVGKLPKGGTTLDYVGHGAVTDRLLEVDPEWNWAPLVTDDRGFPATDDDGNLWIKLTVGGVTRLGCGDGPNMKVLIGDALRNAALRFGVALDLWIKGHAEDDEKQPQQARRRSAPDPPSEPMAGPDEHNVIRDTLGYLTEGQLAEFQAWWKSEGLPSIKREDSLSVAQMRQVEAKLDDLDAGAPAPTPPDDDPQSGGDDAGSGTSPGPDPVSLLQETFGGVIVTAEDVEPAIENAMAKRAAAMAKKAKV